MITFDFKIRYSAVSYSLTVVIIVFIFITYASASNLEVMGEENINLTPDTQAAIINSLAQENLHPTGLVYSESSLYLPPQEHVYEELDYPSGYVNNPAGYLFSEVSETTSPSRFVYGSQGSNINKPSSQPETETDLELSDSDTLPYSGGTNYYSVIALWLFILASFFMKKGIVDKKELGFHNL